MTRRAGTYSLLGFPLPCGLKCSLEPSRSHWGGDSWKFSCGCRLLSCPYPCPSRRINRKQEAYFFFFYVLCKIDIFKSPVTMVTFCFLNWEEKKNRNDSIWRFSDLQWVPAKMSCHRNYSLLPKPEKNDVGSMYVYVWVGVWYTCVHICIIYISSIYYIYLYHISVEGCHSDQPQYICNSFHHPILSCAFTRDFLVSHQKL